MGDALRAGGLQAEGACAGRARARALACRRRSRRDRDHGFASWDRVVPSAPVVGVFRGEIARPVAIEVVDWKGPDYEQHEVHFFFTQPPKPCAFDQHTPGFKIGFSGSITPGRSANAATKLVHPTGAPFAAVLWDKSTTTIGIEGTGWLSATVDATSHDEVRGRIYAWFDDPSRSMIAGAFVAKACNISPMTPGK